MFKKGLATLVILLFVGLTIMPSIYADNMMSLDPVADLDCEGDLCWIDLEPDLTVITDYFKVGNIGDGGSGLNWMIVSWPEWGNWSFDPDNGNDLISGDWVTVEVECILPEDRDEDLFGEIKVINIDNPDDFDTISVFLKGKSVPVVKNTPIQLVFLLINKLRYYEGIEYVESEEDVLQIIESDAELAGIVEELKGYSCGCEGDKPLEWKYPIICSVLLFNYIVTFGILAFTMIELPFLLTGMIANIFDCYWWNY